jgi:hypothetical protein
MTPPTEPHDYSHDVASDRGDLHNEDVAHEHSDINVRAIIYFLVGLAAVTAVAFAAMGALFVVLDSRAARNDPIPSPVAPAATPMPAREESPYLGQSAGPKLITREPEVLAGERAKARKLLESGDWVDRQAGVARIPLAEAKKLLLHQGLPVRADAAVDPRLGTRQAAKADASSGRDAVVKK